ncbi:P-loop containing nucleoside triphosphate hydrolase [Paenibacillus sp. 32O-W]|nr:P-loop containing nucleoside triphosphate hydrolase [Paenibacillus sp. 32O-W]
MVARLFSIRHGATCLVISQRKTTLVHADWNIVLENGRMAAEGTAEGTTDRKRPAPALLLRLVGAGAAAERRDFPPIWERGGSMKRNGRPQCMTGRAP